VIFCKDCEDEWAICDFCKFYNFNGTRSGAYQGLGYCTLLKVGKDPGDGCKRFHCGMDKEKEGSE